MKIIDISGYQRDVDIRKIIKCNKNITGCIIKAGGADSEEPYTDSCLYKHIDICKSFKDLRYGLYYVLDFDKLDVQSTVNDILYRIDGITFNMPLYLDIEMEYVNRKLGGGHSLITISEYIADVCTKLEDEGYYVGIYSSAAFFKSDIVVKYLRRYTWWVAQYGVAKCDIDCDMWQYGQETFEGHKIDVNVCYTDLSVCIESMGFNGLNVQTVDIDMCLNAIKMYLSGVWTLDVACKKIKKSKVNTSKLLDIIKEV